jgi:mRNA-degrading endonuclease YafQ of YafQ-DinJ toxin-antitoxin module
MISFVWGFRKRRIPKSQFKKDFEKEIKKNENLRKNRFRKLSRDIIESIKF